MRKITRQAEGELLTQKESARKAEKKFLGDLDTIRKELNRCCKQTQELDVTNSELKEEVSLYDALETGLGNYSQRNNVNAIETISSSNCSLESKIACKQRLAKQNKVQCFCVVFGSL